MQVNFGKTEKKEKKKKTFLDKESSTFVQKEKDPFGPNHSFFF